MVNDTTAHLGLQLPHPGNELDDDVLRLRSAISGIDAKFALLDALLASNDIDLDTLQELVSAIKGDAANLLAHIGAGGLVHQSATQALAGFMSAADKQALDGHLGAGNNTGSMTLNATHQNINLGGLIASTLTVREISA